MLPNPSSFLSVGRTRGQLLSQPITPSALTLGAILIKFARRESGIRKNQQAGRFSPPLALSFSSIRSAATATEGLQVNSEMHFSSSRDSTAQKLRRGVRYVLQPHERFAAEFARKRKLQPKIGEEREAEGNRCCHSLSLPSTLNRTKQRREGLGARRSQKEAN